MAKEKSKIDYNQIEVEDGGDFMGGGNVGPKEIIMEQWRRCCIEGSKEMVKGGIKTKIVRGVPTQIDVPNQREIFINCVKIFECILTPDIEVEDDVKLQIEQINGKIELYIKNSTEEFQTLKKENEHKKGWNKVVDQFGDIFEIENVNNYREKLTILARLLKKIGYYEEQGFTG